MPPMCRTTFRSKRSSPACRKRRSTIRPRFAFSNGAHVCEIEIDPDTGATRLVGYWGVDDVGTVINPMIVDGQVHGGVAQGLGQALCELCRYDADGQLLSGSFMDYALPRAADLPLIESELDESQPCTHNPLGAKGCGEAGAIAAPAAIVSAVLDALSPARRDRHRHAADAGSGLARNCVGEADRRLALSNEQTAPHLPVLIRVHSRLIRRCVF